MNTTFSSREATNAPPYYDGLEDSGHSRLPQRRFAIGGLIIIVAVAYLIISSFSMAVAAVVTPTALMQRGAGAYGETVRLQGRVVGGVMEQRGTLAHVFQVSDGHKAVAIVYASDLPGGFKGGASVEAQGTYNGHIFSAFSLTAKCPTKYQAAAK